MSQRRDEALAFARDIEREIRDLLPTLTPTIRPYFERLTSRIDDVRRTVGWSETAPSERWAVLLMDSADADLQTIYFLLQDMKNLAGHDEPRPH